PAGHPLRSPHSSLRGENRIRSLDVRSPDHGSYPISDLGGSMQPELQVFASDRVVPLAEASVSVFDAGFQSGDAVWEGMRVYNGRVLKLDRHLRRLEQSANALRIRLPYDASGITEAIHRTLEANDFTDDA